MWASLHGCSVVSSASDRFWNGMRNVLCVKAKRTHIGESNSTSIQRAGRERISFLVWMTNLNEIWRCPGPVHQCCKLEISLFCPFLLSVGSPKAGSHLQGCLIGQQWLLPCIFSHQTSAPSERCPQRPSLWFGFIMPVVLVRSRGHRRWLWDSEPLK